MELSPGAFQLVEVSASKISWRVFSSSCSQIGFGKLLEPGIHSHCLKRQQPPRYVHRIFTSLPSDWTLSRKWMVIRREHEFRSNKNGFQTWKIVTCFWIVLDGQTIIAEWFVDASWTFNVGLCLRTSRMLVIKSGSFSKSHKMCLPNCGYSQTTSKNKWTSHDNLEAFSAGCPRILGIMRLALQTILVCPKNMSTKVWFLSWESSENKITYFLKKKYAVWDIQFWR